MLTNTTNPSPRAISCMIVMTADRCDSVISCRVPVNPIWGSGSWLSIICVSC